MRLCVVHINSEKGSEAYTEQIDGILARSKRADTEIVHKYARLRRATDTVFTWPYAHNALAVVDRMMEAAGEGVDGVMVACSGDAGVPEARTLVDIPVVGPWEATLHLASSYAYKFGVVTVEDRGWSEVCDSLVRANGLETRSVGVRRIRIPSAEAFTRGFSEPSFVAEEIEFQARKLVEAGAGAIVIGSAGLSTITAAAGLTTLSDLGVPIFETLTVGLKTLEMRVDLSRHAGLPPISRYGYLERFDDEGQERVARLFSPSEVR